MDMMFGVPKNNIPQGLKKAPELVVICKPVQVDRKKTHFFTQNVMEKS